MKHPKILVAMPSYNCEKQIGRVLAGFDQKLLDRLEKVIVIDDRGKDNTAEAAQKAIDKLGFGKKIEVVQNVHNLGLGGSHKMAFLYGEKMGVDYVAILHGDDQAKAQELNNLIDVAEKDPSLGAILGCRFMKGSKLIGYSRERIWGNRAINLLYSVVAMRPSLDLGSGLNLFKLKNLADHRYLGFDDRMTFNIDLLLDYFGKKTPLTFTPITWSEEDQVSNARNMTIGKIALRQLFRWRFNRSKFEDHKPEEYKSEPYKKHRK
jgi:glycosyltransferase involved in cell wall biosynthesis